MTIFKACDIRGRAGTELTPEVAERLGRAVGSELAGKPVVVGGDVRPSTGPLKAALVDGLFSAGCHVLDLGVLPTPAFYFAKDRLRAAGGVMVTGSHNPAGDNGFKVSLGAWPVTEAELAGLAQRMAAGDFVRAAGGRVEPVDVVPGYEASIVERWAGMGRAAGFKVVVDAGNGCYGPIAPRVLRRLGYEVVELNCRPDGTFPNRAPNPAVAANLAGLSAAVTASAACLGVGYDGDGDRAVFVDERGQVVESDRSIVLLARQLLGRLPADGRLRNEVIYDIKCSSIVPEQVAAAGGVPVMEKSGHVFIKTALLRRQAVFGGEISGHFFFGELGGDDGLYATAAMLVLLAEAGRGLADLAGELPRYPITPDLRLPCPPGEAQEIVAQVASVFAATPGCEVSTLDGVRVAWPDGWALVRPSVTEPLLTLRFEAHTSARLAEIRAIVARAVPALQKLGVSS